MKNHISMILMVVIAISSLAITPNPTVAGIEVPNSCDDFPRRTKRLCTKFCEKLDCDSEIPQDQILRRLVCNFIEHIFIIKTGIEPPCEPVVCPCDEIWNAIPKNGDCWFQGSPTFGCNDCPFMTANGCVSDPGFGGTEDGSECHLGQQGPGPLSPIMFVGEGFGEGESCGIRDFVLCPSCVHGDSNGNAIMENLTQAEVAACKTSLEQYVTELDDAAGITVFAVPDGPPFNCPGP